MSVVIQDFEVLADAAPAPNTPPAAGNPPASGPAQALQPAELSLLLRTLEAAELRAWAH